MQEKRTIKRREERRNGGMEEETQAELSREERLEKRRAVKNREISEKMGKHSIGKLKRSGHNGEEFR